MGGGGQSGNLLYVIKINCESLINQKIDMRKQLEDKDTYDKSLTYYTSCGLNLQHHYGLLDYVVKYIYQYPVIYAGREVQE